MSTSQQNVSGKKAFDISEDLVAYRSVTLSTSSAQTVGYTGAGGRSDGVVQRAADDSDGDTPNVHLRGRPGTFYVMVAGAVALTDKLYCAASGKMSATVAGAPQMIPLETATADGDIIEAMYIGGPVAGPTGTTTEHHTASDTLTKDESGTIHTNKGAGGSITFTLPAAVAGLEFWFYVGAAQNLVIDPAGAETVSLPSNGVAQATITANAIGETVHIKCCEDGTWAVFGFTGTWT